MSLSGLYSNLPVWAQHSAISLYGYYWRYLRFGPGYNDDVREFTSRERWTEEQWQAWQAIELTKVLSAASQHVPYYRNTWTSSQKLAAKAGQLRELPLLEKEPLRSSPHQFLRHDVNPRGVQVFHTSGSTGTPIAAHFTLRELRRTMALREVRSLGWAGVSFRNPRATFSGRMVEPRPDSQGPFYRYNAAEKQVYFSAFHLRPDTALRYAEALRTYEVQWATGYAVSFYLLARFLLEKGITAPRLKAVITTSEKLTTDMRAVIGQVFQCNVFEEYSTVENAVFASECEHQRLHLSPDAGIVEILRPDGSPCPAGEPGEVVVTSFLRAYQPLVRFRLGDIASVDPEPCPCGRSMPVLKEVIGRVEDVVVGPDGRQMVRFHGVFTNLPHVVEGQIIQEALDWIRVRVVPADAFTDQEVDDIIRRVKQRLGEGVRVTVEPVTEIPRTTAGKFQAVVSKLKPGLEDLASNDK